MRCLQKMLPIVLLCHRSLPSSLWLGLGGQNINLISFEILEAIFLFVEKTGLWCILISLLELWAFDSGHLTSLMPSHLLLLFLYTSHFLIFYKPCAICTVLFLVAISFALEGVRLASCGAFTEQWFFSKNLLKDCFIALVTLGEKRTNEKVKFTFEEGVDNSWKKDAISDSGCEWQVLRHWWPIVLVLFDRLNCFDLCFVYNA